MLLSFCKVRCNVDVLSSNCMPKTITESNPNSAAAAYPHTKQAYWRTCKAKKTILQMHSVQPCEETLAFDRRTSTNETIHTSSHVLLTQDTMAKEQKLVELCQDPKISQAAGRSASNAYKARTSEPPTDAKSATNPNACTV